MKLYVDDMREFPDEGFVCCRDYYEAVHVLSYNEFEYASLDYHLGEGPSGLDILVWLKNNGKYIPHINIHSTHPIGRARMKDFCINNFPQSEITMNYPY